MRFLTIIADNKKRKRMSKKLSIFIIFLLIGCSSTKPISIYTENLTILPPTSPHVPEIGGILFVKTAGYVDQIYYVNPQKSTTQPATKPKTISPINPIDIKDLAPIKDDSGDTIIPRAFRYKLTRSGSGFIAARQTGYYYVVTAKHIVMEKASEITIDDQPGEHVMSFKNVDVSILRFKSEREYPVYDFANTKFMEDAWIVGFPGSIDGKIRKFAVKGHICNISKFEIWFFWRRCSWYVRRSYTQQKQ